MSCCMYPLKRTSFRGSPQKPAAIQSQEQVIVSIPGAQLTLVQSGESIELFQGEFVVVKLTQQGTPIAFIVKVGDCYQWPLTKDEPVVKLDDLHYLFSLRPPSMVDHKEKIEIISYGVKFSERSEAIDSLDKFLSENSCFSAPKDSSIRPPEEVSRDAATVGCWGSSKGCEDEYWKKYAPKVDDYHGVLAKAIAGGTGEIVKGVFICSNAYRTNVQSGGELLQNGAEDNRGSSNKNKGLARKGLKSVRRMTKMTEKLSQSLLDGVLLTTGSVAAPILRSQTGKKFFSMMPGEVLLASLDAVNKVLEAAEIAGRDALSATAGATTRIVSQRFGEDAGQVTDDVFATAGHALGTVWNLFKIRKAFNPASKQGLSTAILQNVGRK